MAEEKSFENKIKEYLKIKEAWYLKYWAGARYTKEGIPDIMACIDGKFYGIEIKATTGRPTLLQIVNLKKVRAAGGIGILLYPEDFEYFKEFVDGTDLGKHWYRENKLKQKDWFNKLSACI